MGQRTGVQRRHCAAYLDEQMPTRINGSMRCFACKLLALLILQVGCGGESYVRPAVQAQAGAKAPADSAARASAANLASRDVATVRGAARGTPPIEEKEFRGAYRWLNTQHEFWPCASGRRFAVTGRAEALFDLRERHRWNSVSAERPQYVVFVGTMVRDTARAHADSVETRFVLSRVDSLRTWQPRDCGGARPVPLRGSG